MTALLTLAFHLGRVVEAVRAMWAPMPLKPWAYRVSYTGGVVRMDDTHIVRVTEVE